MEEACTLYLLLNIVQEHPPMVIVKESVRENFRVFELNLKVFCIEELLKNRRTIEQV